MCTLFKQAARNTVNFLLLFKLYFEDETKGHEMGKVRSTQGEKNGVYTRWNVPGIFMEVKGSRRVRLII
jgi:hypothetical protein